jgi:hypothetical protein
VNSNVGTNASSAVRQLRSIAGPRSSRAATKATVFFACSTTHRSCCRMNSVCLRNIFPFGRNGNPGCSLHLLKSLGLFFNCNNADAITSSLGMYGLVGTEKHVDLPRCERRRTNLLSTRKRFPATSRRYVSPHTRLAPVRAAMRFRYVSARRSRLHSLLVLIASRSFLTCEHLAVGPKEPVPRGPFVK